MGFNAGLCTKCDKPSHQRVETVTGRLLCPDCADELFGASAALISGGGIGEAIATAGWLKRLREWRRESQARQASTAVRTRG